MRQMLLLMIPASLVVIHQPGTRPNHVLLMAFQHGLYYVFPAALQHRTNQDQT